jgi:thymidylate synthase
MIDPRWYVDLLGDVMQNGVVEHNLRTRRKTRVCRGARSISLDLQGRLPMPGVRRMYPASAAAEVAWFLMGTRDVSWLARHAPLWNKFTEIDGVTIAAAYGWRWRVAFGRDQIEEALQALYNDPSDRQIWVQAWDPREDGLGRRGKKNIPCPIGFHLSVVGGALNMAVFIRSSDIFVGLPYDVMGHALLLDAFAASLSLPVGILHITLAHAHLYEDHWDMAASSLAGFIPDDGIQMPKSSIEDIRREPDGYVLQVRGYSDIRLQHPLVLRPGVIE